MDFNDRASAAKIAIANGQFDPQGMNATDFTSGVARPVRKDDSWKQGLDFDAMEKSIGGKVNNDADWKQGLDFKAMEGSLGPVSNNPQQSVQRVDDVTQVKPIAPSAGATAGAKTPNHLQAFDKLPSVIEGAKQGVYDVANLIPYVVGKGLEWVAPNSNAAKIHREINAKAVADRRDFETLYPDTVSPEGLGRIIGQGVATAPALPVRAISAVRGAAESLPYVGKLAGSAAAGGTAGGVFGALTSAGTDKSFPAHMAENVGYGAVGGPIIDTAIGAISKGAGAAGNAVRSYRASREMADAGFDAAGVRNISDRLEAAGLTPAQAKAALNKMGPEATIGDIDEMLMREVGGIIQGGGKPGSVAVGRYKARENAADERMSDILTDRLGVKPNQEAEVEAAKSYAQSVAGPHYTRAKASNMALDAEPIARKIDDVLETAVGDTASELQKVRGWLYDRSGNIKTDTKTLLSVRQELDSHIEKLKKASDTAGKNARNALTDVRKDLDKVLKQNVDLAAGDAAFAKHMEDFGGMQFGIDTLKRKVKLDDFNETWKNASPEKREYIRKGLHSELGDLMELATRGELSEAQRLIGKSKVNREAMRKAFGKDGERLLDDIESEIAMRATNRWSRQQSSTAANLAVRDRYKLDDEAMGSGPLGLALDVATQTPGVGTAIGYGRDKLTKIRRGRAEKSLESMRETSGDILSRNIAQGRNEALDAVERIRQIDKPKASSQRGKRLRDMGIYIVPASKTGIDYGYDQVKSLPYVGK